MSNLKRRIMPQESGKAGYTYDIVSWFGLIPFFLMFIVPLMLYGGRISIGTVDGVYRLEPSHLLYTLLVLGVWLAIVIVFAGLGTRVFPKKRAVSYWPRARLERIFVYLSVFGGAVFVIHQLVVFPPAIENFVHLNSMTAYWALGLGLCLTFGLKQEVSRTAPYSFLTVILFLILTLLPIALGKAAGVALATVAVVVTLYVIRAKFVVKVAAILLACILIVAGMSLKTVLRQALYEGEVYQRQEVVNYILNKPSGRVEHKSYSSPVENGLTKGARVMADSLKNDMSAFSNYDPNEDNIVISKEFLGEYLYFLVARVVHRLNHLSLLGHIMVSTPATVPSWGGASYNSLLFLAIPRAIWPDKPSVGYANLLGRQYKLIQPEDRMTTVNVDPVTEAWVNGGWLAVIFSSAGIGLLFGAILGWLGSGGDQHIRLLAALTVALHMAVFESETALIVGGLVQGLLFLGAAVVSVGLLNKGHRFLFPACAS